MAIWLYGHLVAWPLGCMATQLHGCMATWMTILLYGHLVAWPPRCVATKLYGHPVACTHSCMATELHVHRACLATGCMATKLYSHLVAQPTCCMAWPPGCKPPSFLDTKLHGHLFYGEEQGNLEFQKRGKLFFGRYRGRGGRTRGRGVVKREVEGMCEGFGIDLDKCIFWADGGA